jgi:lipoprotein-anchoring transpeptidase ErfK/SrfK
MIINTVKNIYRTAKLNTKVLSDSLLIKAVSNTSENFVNNNGLSSKTSYLIWVDTKNFKVNVFKGSKGAWKLLKSYSCSIGKSSTPTPKGTFYVGAKGYSFGYNHGYVCYYYTQFKGNYLFHSILYNLNGTVKDGRLGMQISDGCIRLAKVNAKWLYDNVSTGTTVFIN